MDSFRRNRLLDKLEQSESSVLIATSLENVYYITGFYSTAKKMVPSTQLYGVMVEGDGEPWLILPVSELPSALESGIREDKLLPYGTFFFESVNIELPICSSLDRLIRRSKKTAAEALSDLLSRWKTNDKKACLDISGLDAMAYRDLMATVGNRCIDNGLACFQYARKIKDDLELAALKEASNIAETALMTTLNGLRVGVSEKEIERRYHQEVLRLGGEPTFGVFTFDLRGAFVDTVCRGDNLLKRGSVIRADVGCSVKGYQADMARTAIMGENEHAKQTYEAMREGQLEAISRIRPGVPFRHIYGVAMEVVHKAGVPNYHRTHCGHCLGLKISEPPHIRPDSQDYLEERMVLCVETPYYEIGWGGVQVEDTLAVTHEGYELLTKSDSKLIVLS